MEQTRVDMYLTANADKFNPADLMVVREKLEKMSEDRFMIVQAADLRSPVVILLIAIFLGWERFFLDDIGLGILKIITCYGLGIWGLVDMFTAMDRARKYNFRKFMSLPL